MGFTVNLEYVKRNIDDKRSLILAVDDLTPNDTINLPLESVVGILIRDACPTSHAVIVAKNLGIPVLMTTNVEKMLNKLVILDGLTGFCKVEPDEVEQKDANDRLNEYRRNQKEMKESVKSVQKTRDGKEIQVMANVGSLTDVVNLDGIADGIGVFRTELLFMNRLMPPSEEDHFNTYFDVLKNVKKPVVIRTFDIGGDKPTKFFNHPIEENPSLGYRASRIISNDMGRKLFKDQVKGILRAAIFGEVSIMIPMISHIEQFLYAKKLIEEVRQELISKATPFKMVDVGIMIEIPSSCLIAEHLAEVADFFSIGTNDLTQYTLAVDRQNIHVKSLYSELHPALLKLIKMTVDAAQLYNKPVSVCGELASNPIALSYLVGLGIDRLSMNSHSVPIIKNEIKGLSYNECKKNLDVLYGYSNLEDAINFLENRKVCYESIV